MKKSSWVVIATGAAILLVVALVGFRERGFFGEDKDEDDTEKTESSRTAPAEKPSPLQTGGQTLTFNFDNDNPGGKPTGFHGARTGQGAE